VLVLSEQMSPSAISWMKQRKRSALLLWSDFGEAPDALNKLLDPHRQRRHSYLEELRDHHLRLLFVDDSPTVRIAFRRLLMKHGFLVETAATAIEGYRKALQQPFDMAIIDYFMPEQNGVALVRKLRGDVKTAHIVPAVITGTYSDTVINDSLAAGAVECIFKNEARELFLTRIASMARSIIDRKSVDNERRRLEGILRSVGDGVYGVDANGVIQFINPAAREILDFGTEQEVIGSRAYDLFHSRFEDGTPMPVDSCFLSQCYWSGNQVSGWQTSFWSHSGRTIPVECTVFPLEIEGQRQGSVIAFRDVSARKQLEEELRWQATHDSLTKLGNRAQFEDELEQEVHRLNRSDQISALLYLDLDRFKYINDTAGHAAGDRLLIEVAQRLKSRLRASDSLARIGGDEYAVILRNVRTDSVIAASDQFRVALEELPFSYGGKQYLVSATIGVAMIDEHTATPGEVMSNADIACHLAKNQGRNRIHVFSSENDEKAAMDMELGWSRRLKDALDRNQHHPQQDGEISDYEVLVRLQDSEGNLIAPDAFLPTAERFSMMGDIDRWVINNALDVLQRLHKDRRHCRFSINLSEESMNDPTTVDFISDALRRHGVEPRYLTLELAETRAVANIEVAQRLVGELKRLGCSCGLDDFGTGFASFAHLKQLDVDFLKIDGAFLRGMSNDPINSAVLSSIANIAQALGKRTIAECVENARAVQALRNSGIDELQGFFIARPHEAVDFGGERPVSGAPNVTPINRGKVS
jgi:diguanylate cyclase (GGDEF)-like protein/PAS domain S-box-containing protein